MPNHTHLLIERRDDSTSRVMQGLLTAYSQYHNRKHRKSAHLFQGRYKSILCQTDQYLAELVRYIHLNPVRSRIVRKPEEFQYSSHRVYLGLEDEGLDRPRGLGLGSGPRFLDSHSSAYTQFDFYLGRLVDAEDANGVVSSAYSEYDPLDRPTKVIRAANQSTSIMSQTIFVYDDTNHVITTTSDQVSFNDPNPLKSETVYDGLGRTIESRSYESSTQYIAVQQVPFVLQPDPDTGALVAAAQSSNPFRPYLGEQPIWTTTFSDALGRVTKIRTPDNAIVRTSYSGNTVTVTDQASKSRKSVTDGLGRLIQVYEAPNDSNYNYLTSYVYDALGDLTH
jgi:hypothetical protein